MGPNLTKLQLISGRQQHVRARGPSSPPSAQAAHPPGRGAPAYEGQAPGSGSGPAHVPRPDGAILRNFVLIIEKFSIQKIIAV
jgi:hypothetical protein